MRFARTLALAALSALAFSAEVRADTAATKAKLTEESRLQEGRANELQNIANNDEKWGHDLENQAKGLEGHAAAMEARGGDFKTLAGGMADAGMKAELNGFANELGVYAKHDREAAVARRKLGEQVVAQGKGAAAAAKDHREHAAKLKAYIAKLK
jgi:hypothetical protein